jgi:4-amino-4-deoxy-L-arabinose transferase-like glycosyltransferase
MWTKLGIILILAGSLQIISTYTIFSPTNDERTNIGSGIEWWAEGTYNNDPTNPPLARIFIALLPYLESHDAGGALPIGQPGMTALQRGEVADLTGEDAVFGSGHPLRNLSLARLGILPFFVLASVTVYLLAKWTFGAPEALLAVLLFTTLPPVLAHAGLATSDFAEAAVMILAVFAFVVWLPSPTIGHSFALGAAVAIALVTKFSAMLFLPACFMVLLIWFGLIERNLRPSMITGALYACLAMCVVIWATYRFSVGPILLPGLISPEHQDRYAYLLRSGIVSTLVSTPVPAPEFFRGIAYQYMHNAIGHGGYLLGEVRQSGRWYFFPVALAVKTPLPSLILGVVGGVGLLLRSWRCRKWRLAIAPLCCITLLASVVPSHINIGLRYILPIYGFMAITASYGAAVLWRAIPSRLVATAIVAALCGWQALSLLAWHPDHLAYFNEAADFSRTPILVDSDLDWGQDFFRLSAVLKDRNIAQVSVALFGFENCPGLRRDQANYNFPATASLLPNEPRAGWLAVSYYVLYELPGYSWLRQYEPVTRVGSSILLYHLSEDDIRRAVITGQQSNQQLLTADEISCRLPSVR